MLESVSLNRVDQLAEAQKITEQKLAELAEAQKRTEDRLDRTNRLLGDLSMSFGYFLENESPYLKERNCFPYLVCHMVSEPAVPDYAKRRGIALYYSYRFK